MNFYDSKNKRLIYTGAKPTAAFWDVLWEEQLRNHNEFLKKIDLIVKPTTKKYLKPKSKILEGGCGHGTYVEILNQAGFDCIGVDFAKSTIKKIKYQHPNLPIYYGDLTKLQFGENSFDGYWSLGVIEHFYDGFDPILSEMEKVLKKGGFVFVTFPYMSPLRKIKSSLGLYQKSEFKKEPQNFYQFALNHQSVIKNFRRSQFKLIEQKPFDGVSGLRKEIPQLGFILNPLSKYSTKYILVAGIRFILSKLVEKFSSHSILLVFQKT